MTDFNKQDTYGLQALSLTRFMEVLGYEPTATNFGRIQFKTDLPQLKPIRVLSFATAVRLHNAGVDGWKHFQEGVCIPGVVTLPMFVGAAVVSKAYGSRIVENVKFQADKNAPGGVRLVSHMVKFLNPLLAQSAGF